MFWRTAGGWTAAGEPSPLLSVKACSYKVVSTLDVCMTYLNSWDQSLLSAHAPSGLSYAEVKPLFSWVPGGLVHTLAGRQPFIQVQQHTY